MHSHQNLVIAGGIFSLLFLSAFLLSRLKVPYIVSFLISGFLGKLLFPHEAKELLSILELSAIILLFFFIGLEYSFERLMGMRRVIKPGLIDFVFNFFPAFLIAFLFTQNLLFSLIMGAVMYPSSTAITAKLLMDYRRLVNPEAELLIGVLIFEDLISIILLSALTGIRFGGGFDTVSLLRGILAVVLVFTLFYLLIKPSQRVFEYMYRKVDESLIPFAVLGFLLMSAGFGLSLGLSDALIAFMLGVLVPEESKIYRTIERSLSDLKDIAVGVFFFMFTFKSQISLDINLWLLLLLLISGILLKLFSTYMASLVYDLSKRTALRASLSFLQRGEFSVIFASLYEPTQSLAFFLVLTTALIGSFSFVYAPRLSERVFPKKEKKGPLPAPPA